MALLIAFIFFIILAALVGGALPLFFEWSDRLLHLFLATTTGIFLGAVFLHLLPELASHDAGKTPWFMVLGGLLLVYAFETFMFPHRYLEAEEAHGVLGYATFTGLAIHSFAEGIGLVASLWQPSLGLAVFMSIFAHKLAAAFSLSTVFQLAEFPRRKIINLLIIFSCMTPIGAVCGYFFLGQGGGASLIFPTALATGTFIYVALCDLLPEVFHRPHDNYAKLGLLLLGIAVMWLVGEA